MQTATRSTDGIATEARAVGVVLPPTRRLLVRRVRDLLRVMVADTHGAASEARLAGEAELMAEYAAPRDAVREALCLLADEGLIARRRGLGTLSVGDAINVNIKLPREGQPLACQFDPGDRLSAQLLEWTWMPCPAAVATRLTAVESGDDCLCIDYVLLRNERPICLITNYLRRAEGSTLSAAQFLGDFYALLRHVGSEVRTQDVVLQPRLADAEISSLLDVTVGEPTMWMEQLIRDEEGRAIDFAIVHMRGDLRVRIPNVPTMSIGEATDGFGR